VVLVDSDALIRYLRGRAEAIRALSQLQQEDILACSVITTYEVLRGCTPMQEPATEGLLASLVQLPVTEPITRLAATQAQSLRYQNVTIALPDLLIGCTALERGIPLLTGNSRHYSLPGLRLIPL
jgi:tRNA(fMet)-specific endonuclease VapC